jgi:hypothetical protein
LVFHLHAVPDLHNRHYAGGRLEALGIGDVQLPVKLFPKRSGPAAHGTLHLRNVLHVLNCLYNIVGGPQTGDYSSMQLRSLENSGNWGAILAEDGRRLGYFVHGQLWVLKLSGPLVGLVGRSSFEPDVDYVINATWPNSERRRWDAARTDPLVTRKGEASDGREGKGTAEASPSEPYTKEEKDWLKKHRKGELKFLTVHGLSIYKEGDRDEGRQMVRAMMGTDEDEDTNSATRVVYTGLAIQLSAIQHD